MILSFAGLTTVARVRVLHELSTRLVERWLAAGATPEEVALALGAREVEVSSLRARPDALRRARARGGEAHRHETDCEELLRAVIAARRVLDVATDGQTWLAKVPSDLAEQIRLALRQERQQRAPAGDSADTPSPAGATPATAPRGGA